MRKVLLEIPFQDESTSPKQPSLSIVSGLKEEIMKTSLIVVAVLASFLSTINAAGQAQRSGRVADHVSQLADEKIEVSKLDWIMLMARVRILEEMARENSRSVSSTGMHYDPETKRVVVRSFVDPDWIAEAKMDDAKKILVKRATSYCVDGLALAEGETGEILAGSNMKGDCAVQHVGDEKWQGRNKRHSDL
jgi:hypothetical protein